MRIVQLRHPEHHRRIAKVEEPDLVLLKPEFRSCYDLFSEIVENGLSPKATVEASLSGTTLDYGSVYEGADDWKLLPAFDHPDNPHACLLSGTGLTHKASAKNREAMHEKLEAESGNSGGGLTDSMKIYLWGEEKGKPEPGAIGVQPEWFYKGTGSALRGHGDFLEVPPYAEDGGEEPEIAGIYYIDTGGVPHRIGFATANEFSDHVMEKQNYLYLAPSKLRSPSIGPELVLTDDFSDLAGTVSIERDGGELWARQIRSGEENMAHSLANLEYHHFKYAQHRIPGMVHIHFFGTGAFSFGEGIRLLDGDVMTVAFDGFGRPLRNRVRIDPEPEKPVGIRTL